MRNRGFTLLELSIVLVIIGLIAGGVIAGQEMIKSAELRSVMNDLVHYQTAVIGFREKYGQLPGDFDKAEDFWGTDTNGCPAGGGTGVCNGNGDGKIFYWTVGGWEEFNMAWKHLSSGGFIPGQYSGDTGNIIIGGNRPASKITGGCYGLVSQSTTSTAYYDLNFIDEESITFSGASGTLPYAELGILSPTDAWSIDKKIDDGDASRGKLLATDGNSTTGCTDKKYTTGLRGVYELDNDGVLCQLRLRFL